MFNNTLFCQSQSVSIYHVMTHHRANTSRVHTTFCQHITCWHNILPTHNSAKTSSWQHIIMPIHNSAKSSLCQHIYHRANTQKCQDIIAPTHHRTNTSSCQHIIVPKPRHATTHCQSAPAIHALSPPGYCFALSTRQQRHTAELRNTADELQHVWLMRKSDQCSNIVNMLKDSRHAAAWHTAGRRIHHAAARWMHHVTLIKRLYITVYTHTYIYIYI